MSVAAVMLVKDEADIIETTVRHLLASGVDEVIVGENLSTDGTVEILEALAVETGTVVVYSDAEVGYYQDRKTTELAQLALLRGHRWVIPCDADEIWHPNDLRPLGDFLAGVGPDVMLVEALVYNHLATDADDPDETNPVRRLRWRQRNHGMKKVACRLRPDLRIHMGNHDASTDGSAVRAGGLSVRHFSWRSADQYVRKIRNGAAAYAATNLDQRYGVGWRMMEGKTDAELVAHFMEWFFIRDPGSDPTLIDDPAPLAS